MLQTVYRVGRTQALVWRPPSLGVWRQLLGVWRHVRRKPYTARAGWAQRDHAQHSAQVLRAHRQSRRGTPPHSLHAGISSALNPQPYVPSSLHRKPPHARRATWLTPHRLWHHTLGDTTPLVTWLTPRHSCLVATTPLVPHGSCISHDLRVGAVILDTRPKPSWPRNAARQERGVQADGITYNTLLNICCKV